MIEGTGSESQAKTELAAPERKDRIAKQKARLTGLTLQNEFERWHYSQKLITDMLQKDTIIYLAPSKFPTRRAELSHECINKEIVLDVSASLKVQDRRKELSCDTSTELWLYQALTHRALAMDLVGSSTYACMELYNAF